MASIWHLIFDVINKEFSSREKKTLRLVSRLFSINMLIDKVRVEAPGNHPWIRSGKLLCEGATLENCLLLDISEWSGRLSSLPSVKSLVLRSSQIDSLDCFPRVVQMTVKADSPFVDVSSLEGRSLWTLMVEGTCEVFICNRPVKIDHLRVSCSNAIIDASRMISINVDGQRQTVELSGTSGLDRLMVSYHCGLTISPEAAAQVRHLAGGFNREPFTLFDTHVPASQLVDFGLFKSLCYLELRWTTSAELQAIIDALPTLKTLACLLVDDSLSLKNAPEILRVYTLEYTECTEMVITDSPKLQELKLRSKDVRLRMERVPNLCCVNNFLPFKEIDFDRMSDSIFEYSGDVRPQTPQTAENPIFNTWYLPMPIVNTPPRCFVYDNKRIHRTIHHNMCGYFTTGFQEYKVTLEADTDVEEENRDHLLQCSANHGVQL